MQHGLAELVHTQSRPAGRAYLLDALKEVDKLRLRGIQLIGGTLMSAEYRVNRLDGTFEEAHGCRQGASSFQKREVSNNQFV